MTNVVGIEFCTSFFKDINACKDWISKSEHCDLARVQGFHLRKNNTPRFLTNERKRTVWKWDMGYGKFQALRIKRYGATPVVVIVADGPRFVTTDFPAPLPATIEYEKEKKKRQEEANRKRKATRDAKKLAENPDGIPAKPKRAKKSKKKT